MTDMNFEDSLDVLIATSITCLRNRDHKLKRAIEIAINYRSLSPASARAISLEQLDALQKWLASAKGRSDATNCTSLASQQANREHEHAP
jgi:hypothetical protein